MGIARLDVERPIGAVCAWKKRLVAHPTEQFSNAYAATRCPHIRYTIYPGHQKCAFFALVRELGKGRSQDELARSVTCFASTGCWHSRCSVPICTNR
jgi:hypothetical protein